VEELWRPEWDSAIYILTGRAMAAGDGYSYLGRPFFSRPPGLSWLISLVNGAGEFDPKTLNLMVMFFAGTAVAAIYFGLAQFVGRWKAIAVAMLSGTSTILALNFNFVLSEFPFLTFFFVGVGLLQIGSNRKANWWVASFAGAICIAGAFYMRSAALLLMPGMFLIGWRHDRGVQRWRALLPAAVAVILILPWIVHSKRVSAVAEKPYEQLAFFDYSTAMFHVDPGDPASDLLSLEEWCERITENSADIIRYLSISTFGPASLWAGFLLVVAALAGLFLAIYRRTSILEWFFVAYTALLLTYFDFVVRLLIPMVPLVYLYMFDVISKIGEFVSKRFDRMPATAVLGVAAFAAMMMVNLVPLPRLLALRNKDTFTEKMYVVSAWVRTNTPPDAVLLCRSAPIISVLTDRTAYTYAVPRSADMLSIYEPDYVIFDVYSLPASFEQYVAENSVWRWVSPDLYDGRPLKVYKIGKPQDAGGFSNPENG
jgi:4-amino-4-deoxy-L-arabinose transferase-like glycosyltransferase